jgi:ribonuclease BN (tRNA processing enzyme)
MEIVFIGTGCGVPSSKRRSPGILINTKADLLLFDLGPGACQEVVRAGFKLNDVTTIFLSHFHVDHTADLPAFLFASRYPLDRRTKSLTLVGPRGLKEFYARLLALYKDQLVSSHYNIHVVELNGGLYNGDGWKVAAAPTTHSGSSLCYRIDDIQGRGVVYSGDADYTRSVVELAKKCDVLILECSFPDKLRVEGHLTPLLCGRIARECGCKRLILTHLYPVCDASEAVRRCRDVFSGDVISAKDGMRIQVGSGP